MANSSKASLTTSQGVSAVIAGIIGHLLFSLAWLTLVIGVVGLVSKNLIFSAIDNLINQIELRGDAGSTLVNILETVRGALNTLSLVFIISSAVSIVIAFLISGAIMKAGKVRKPFGATFSAMVIVGILDIGLFWLYLFIGFSASDETGFLPTYPIAAVIGTVVVGALVWLWMAHIRRAPLSEVEAAHAVPAVVTTDPVTAESEAAAAVAPAATAPVLDTSSEPAASAPVVDPDAPVTAVEPAVKKPVASKPASTTPAAKKPIASTPSETSTPSEP